MAKMRINTVLQAFGIASRRKADRLILENCVSINGKICNTLGTQVDIQCDTISVEGRVLEKPQRKLYYLLHKPRNVTCSEKRKDKEPLVLDLFPSDIRVFTVGRLDRNTEGLLLVTNDGEFAQKVIHPRANIEKEYIVTVNKPLSKQDLQAIRAGFRLPDNRIIRPKRVTKLQSKTLSIVIMEGKNREIHRLVAQSSHRVVQLTRIRIGRLHLPKMSPGTYKKLSPAQRTAIFS